MAKLSFEERIGIPPVTIELQIGSITQNLSTRLLNILTKYLKEVSKDQASFETKTRPVFNDLWEDYFVLDSTANPLVSHFNYPANDRFIESVRDVFKNYNWSNKYRFIEYLVSKKLGEYERFSQDINLALEKEHSGYRLVEGQFFSISNEEELQTIRDVFNSPSEWGNVEIHMKSAIRLFSDLDEPNYRNSIKEAISAVEAACKSKVKKQKTTLGKALGELEAKYNLPKNIKNAMDQLYGFTNNHGGIRHSIDDKNIEVTQNEAKFMIITCSAFVNYLKAL